MFILAMYVPIETCGLVTMSVCLGFFLSFLFPSSLHSNQCNKVSKLEASQEGTTEMVA